VLDAMLPSKCSIKKEKKGAGGAHRFGKKKGGEKEEGKREGGGHGVDHGYLSKSVSKGKKKIVNIGMQAGTRRGRREKKRGKIKPVTILLVEVAVERKERGRNTFAN